MATNWPKQSGTLSDLGKVIIYDNIGRKALNVFAGKIDSVTDSLQVVNYEHHEIHSGSHYYICGYDPDMDSTEDVEFQLTTPNSSKWIHMVFEIASTGATVFSIYEDATVTADGTPITAYNNNRNSSNTSDITLLQTDGTVTAAGTLIFNQAWGVGGNANQRRGGATERDKEIILKQNTTYRFLIESNSDNNVVSYCAEWYEHTNAH